MCKRSRGINYDTGNSNISFHNLANEITQQQHNIYADLNRSTASLVIMMPHSRCILRNETSDRERCGYKFVAHSRFEEIRRETTRGARSRMQMRDVVAHKGEIDISFSAGQDSKPEVVLAGSRNVRGSSG